MALIILNGGNRAQQDAYTGVSGELSHETDSPELRLHDGSTVGGLRILGLIANDLRYQGKNTDLTALGGHTTEKGFMSRLGPGNYVLRSIVGTAGQVSVANPTGDAGNVTVSLPAEITKAINFTLAISSDTSFTAPTFFGNLTGDVSGDTAGIHTGAVVGNVTGDLVGDVTGDVAGILTGGFDVSGGSIQFAAGQIPASALADSYVLTSASNLVPSGFVGLWTGTEASIPSGWVACNGSNGTPDLRDRFVVGTGPTYSRGTSGGAATHNHGTIASANSGGHTPSVTVSGHALTAGELPTTQVGCGIGLSSGDAQVPNHGTRAQSNPNRSMSSDGDSAATEPLTQEFGNDESHNHGATADAVAAHSHNTTIPALSNLPPYYSLIYIMKI